MVAGFPALAWVAWVVMVASIHPMFLLWVELVAMLPPLPSLAVAVVVVAPAPSVVRRLWLRRMAVLAVQVVCRPVCFRLSPAVGSIIPPVYKAIPVV